MVVVTWPLSRVDRSRSGVVRGEGRQTRAVGPSKVLGAIRTVELTSSRTDQAGGFEQGPQ